MTRIPKPEFGTRHHRPEPQGPLGAPQRNGRQRIDWMVVALVVIVFIAGFVWLLPALGQ